MKLKAKILKLKAGRPVAILHKKTADKLSVNIDDRITLNKGNKKMISVVDIAVGLLQKDEVAVSDEELQRKIKILGELIALKMRDLALRMGLKKTGDYSQGFLVDIKKGTIIIKTITNITKIISFQFILIIKYTFCFNWCNKII